MKRRTFIAIPWVLASGWRARAQPSPFVISIDRYFARQVKDNKDKLVIGAISVNGSVIGNCYENDSLKVKEGTYPGLLRYWSKRGFVQGPFGTLGNIGDFLVQLENVRNEEGEVRTGILLHGGNQPKHSTGCILLGPVYKDPGTGTPVLDDKHPLRRLRQLFYGSDTPNSTPNKEISVVVSSKTVSLKGTWKGTFKLTQGTLSQSLPAELVVAADGNATITIKVTAGAVPVAVKSLAVQSDGTVSFGFGAQTFAGTLGNDLATFSGRVTVNGAAQGPLSLTRS